MLKKICAAEVMFGLVELSWVGRGWGGGSIFLYISSSLVSARLHTENWLCNLPRSVLKVPVVGGLVGG